MAIPTRLSVGALDAGERAILFGSAEVTGTLTIDTGLKTVEDVFTSLEEDAALTGLFVTHTIADQGTEPGEITLKVWKPTAAGDVTPLAGIVAKTVNYMVIGKTYAG